jgi:hypothetical protein
MLVLIGQGLSPSSSPMAKSRKIPGFLRPIIAIAMAYPYLASFGSLPLASLTATSIDGRRRRTCVSTDAPTQHSRVRSTPSLDDGVERQVAHSYHPLTLRICAFPWELERLHTSPLDTSMTFQGPPLQVWLPPRRSRPKSRGRPPSRISSRLSRRLVSTLTQLTLVSGLLAMRLHVASWPLSVGS